MKIMHFLRSLKFYSNFSRKFDSEYWIIKKYAFMVGQEAEPIKADEVINNVWENQWNLQFLKLCITDARIFLIFEANLTED